MEYRRKKNLKNELKLGFIVQDSTRVHTSGQCGVF